jgi:hypothetical protein
MKENTNIKQNAGRRPRKEALSTSVSWGIKD